LDFSARRDAHAVWLRPIGRAIPLTPILNAENTRELSWIFEGSRDAVFDPASQKFSLTFAFLFRGGREHHF